MFRVNFYQGQQEALPMRRVIETKHVQTQSGRPDQILIAMLYINRPLLTR